MPEIKVIKSDVEPVFQDLKAKINELDTTSPNADFIESKLDFIKKIESIEEQYYKTIQNYKTILQKSEHEAWSNIESFIEVEQNVARTIQKETVR
ncbi:YwqI/YxiC family protein [Bacillus sp. FJAT-47783]|uniref:YwqI/YxiC family protein n=1 Tax=Bacillus sp. FJAT-47783 TaxID=2922712 RepID=UPI001FACFE9A|nr:YwqI/YxiC family protein [Bacillus sp. FJAT-47783]